MNVRCSIPSALVRHLAKPRSLLGLGEQQLELLFRRSGLSRYLLGRQPVDRRLCVQRHLLEVAHVRQHHI